MPGKFDDNIYRTVFLSFNVGRHLKITKKKVEWGLLYNNQEHVVMLKQSIITGKKQIYLDKRVIFEDSKVLEIQFTQEISFDGMRVVISCEIKDKEILHRIIPPHNNINLDLSINEKKYETLPYLNRAQVANAQRYNKKIIPACLLYDVPPGENISMFEASKTDQAVERAKAYLEDSSSDEEEEEEEESSDESSSDEDKKKKKSKKSKKSAKKNNKKKSKKQSDDSSSSSDDDDDDDDSSSEDSSEDESSKKKKQLAKKKQLIAQRKKSMPAAILTQRKKTMPATIKPRAKSTVKKVTWAEDIEDDEDEDDDEEYVVTRINKKKVKVPLKHSKFISRSSGEESSSDEDDLPKNRKPIKKMTKKNIPKAPAIEAKPANYDFDDLFA